ncbi:MAG: adaptor protein MecA [Lachnospiraceae bacterium]|nr:adaptor protein MecA [Lachnospiraceae bacterium]
MAKKERKKIENMRFTKLGEKDIRCIITESELIDFGLNLDDIIERTDRTKDFFRQVLDIGSKQLGMGKKDGLHLASAQISVLKDNSISIIFHETSVDEILDNLAGGDRERVEKLKRDIEEAVKENPKHLPKKIRNDIVDVMEERIRQEGNMTPAVMAEIRQIREEIEKDEESIRVSENRFRMCAVRFTSLDDAIRFCAVADHTGGFSSSFYKSGSEKEYYLIIDRNDMPIEKYSGMLFNASEYGSVSELTDAGRAFLVSHSELMIEDDAFHKLRSIEEDTV